ncbi:MAG: hypothetical protein ACI8RZ_002531 [Myxococcota bacterium]|jgi:hypothetical protein
MWKWGIAILWFLIWGASFVGFQFGSRAKKAEVEYFAQPLTGLEPGGTLRVEGRLAPAPEVVSPYSGAIGAAVYVDYSLAYSATDSQGNSYYNHYNLGPLVLAEESVRIAVGRDTIVLPRDRWTPHETSWHAVSSTTQEAPEALQASPEQLAEAEETLSGTLWGYQVQETVLALEAEVFIIGRLEAAAPSGDLRIAADPELGRVEVYPGTQADLVAFLGSESRGLFWASFAFLGLALIAIPLLRLSLRVPASEA